MDLGTCPVCNGTGRRSAANVPYKTVYTSYDSETDTLDCNNCGGQYMYGKPSGQVTLRSDGTPCTHEYNIYSAGRCLTRYVCKHCVNNFTVDSGD